MKSRLVILLLSLLLRAGLALSIVSAAIAQTDSPGVAPTAPAFARPHPRQPIALRIKIAIVAGGAAVSLAVLVYAARHWRSWNLFDRQYRFTPVKNVALRLGGTRSGGCMATLDFRRSDSGREDA